MYLDTETARGRFTRSRALFYSRVYVFITLVDSYPASVCRCMSVNVRISDVIMYIKKTNQRR